MISGCTNELKNIENLNDLTGASVGIYTGSEYDNIADDKIVDVYKMENRDGEYYSINPNLVNDCNYGINFYPLTHNRKTSGYIIVERFLLNSIFSSNSIGNCEIFISSVRLKLLPIKSLHNFDNNSYFIGC